MDISEAMFIWMVSLLSFAHAGKIFALPGQPKAHFNQYSGYFTVGKGFNHKLHYWFQESQGNSSTDPLLLWLMGGPGCSGLAAILTEWGPFLVNNDGATLRQNPYAWNKNASILTLEAPAGVGFSYATDGDISANDNKSASENWEALRLFFMEFPWYRKNDFYVTGESYGGVYVPTLIQYILDHQTTFNINIKGFAIGNGLVHEALNLDTLIQFQHKHGLIDELQWGIAKTECCANDTDDCAFHSFTSAGGFCEQFIDAAESIAWYSDLNTYNLYSDCTNQDSARFKLEFKKRFGKAPHTSQANEAVPCFNETAVTDYLNRRDVRRALYVPEFLPPWSMCNDEITANYVTQYQDLSLQVNNAIQKGLKGMLYYGDVDMACNFLMGQKFSAQLGLTQTQQKTPFLVRGQVGGFSTKYGSNFHFVTVRGAGHVVPMDKAPAAFHIISAFLSNEKF